MQSRGGGGLSWNSLERQRVGSSSGRGEDEAPGERESKRETVNRKTLWNWTRDGSSITFREKGASIGEQAIIHQVRKPQDKGDSSPEEKLRRLNQRRKPPLREKN